MTKAQQSFLPHPSNSVQAQQAGSRAVMATAIRSAARAGQDRETRMVGRVEGLGIADLSAYGEVGDRIDR